jgi:ferredoxin-NADP reductase
MSGNSIYKTLRIGKITEPVQNFKLFEFEDDQDIKYKAGQFLTLVRFNGGTEIRRSYSLTSAPGIDQKLSVGIKRVPNGFFSRQMIDYAQPGDEVLTTGAAGLFSLPNNIEDYKQIYLFAAGSGITPCYSLLKNILYNHAELHVVLVYSNQSIETTIFSNELKALQHEYPERMKLQWLFSDSKNLATARLYPELVARFTTELSLASSAETLYYICGPLVYMDMCTFTLQSLAIPKENIRKENFIVEGIQPIRQLPPDRSTHQVLIQKDKDTFSIEVTYPDTILQAARKSGVILPYSCESGRCGNCVARCTSGKVWHSYNEVLTDRELEQGMILTCVGHPVFGDVTLDFS